MTQKQAFLFAIDLTGWQLQSQLNDDILKSTLAFQLLTILAF